MPYFATQMKKPLFLLTTALLLLLSSSVLRCSEKELSTLNIAFYNLENLYDIVDDTTHSDDDFTPNGKYQWSAARYQEKLNHLARVIASLSDDNTPDVLGMCELENDKVLKDLFATKALNNRFQFVHYNSPDERGVDVALAYNPKKIKVLESKNYPVKLSLDSNDRTRDILWVKSVSLTNQDTIHFLVCHFPSRRGGASESQQNRIDAAQTCKAIIKERLHPQSQNLVIMGDFNDQPWDTSMMKVLGAHSVNKYPNADLINLMFELADKKSGSYCFRGRWERIDQIIISQALRNASGTDYQTGSVQVVKKDWMLDNKQEQPFRNFKGEKWMNGYSDHLPVCAKLNLNAINQ